MFSIQAITAFGDKGDSKALNSYFIQRTVEACCPDSGRTIVTLSGTTATRVSQSNVNNKTYNLRDWYCDAVTGPGYGKGIALYGSDICTQGGTVCGHIDPDLTWRQVHDDVGGYGYQIQVEGNTVATVIDARIHNVEDGFKPRETPYYSNLGTFNLWGAYMTMMRDDCIENDGFMPGRIEDGLFDGVFCFYSEQEQSRISDPVTIGQDEDRNVYISNVYVRTDMTNGLDTVVQYTCGAWFKIMSRRYRVAYHKIHIENSVFAVSVAPKKKGGSPDWGRAGFPSNTAFSGTNYVLWLGAGTFGGSVPAGVTFLEGAAAHSKWQQVKRDWLSSHGYLPERVTATPGGGQVRLSWTDASEVTTYNVLRSTTSGGPLTTIAGNLNGTSYVDAGLTNGTTYYYVVEAVDYCGVAQTTVEVSATPGG